LDKELILSILSLRNLIFSEVMKLPEWIDQSLEGSAIDLFILCNFDLDWISDPVRENPGARRKVLFEQYRKEIELLGIPWELVSGIGPERFRNAQDAIKRHFPHIQIHLK